MRKYFFLFCMLFCASAYAALAPVLDATTIELIPKSGIHLVKKGETFYSIAWRYGLNYQTLALKNNIKRPYNIEIGEKIYLRANHHKTVLSLKSPQEKFLAKKINEPIAAVTHWHWPAKGRIIGIYSTYNKGINISGRKGDPVYAAADGKIVYNGDGLRSYGNLIIIKHNSRFLTAYAHNKKTFVRQGEWVRAGQRIAQMGNTGTNNVMLHFEIRKEGAPVNPLRYLSRR